MDITEVSILHHVAIMLIGIWILSAYNLCHSIVYFVALIYLYLVHERYVTRLRRKLQFEERKQSNQRRVLSDSETVRWLNHAIENIWPICMEQIASQKILLPIIPWFLEKYKPWTAKEAVVQHLYLGRNPPLITEIRVLRQSNDDHLVLELGMNFLTADDMSAILAVKLRKRLGFGMTAKLHITGMHVEGKVLVGVKFIRTMPFLSRVRVCFVEPPYFQMTVKPIFTHGLDVTELPGIAGWLDKLLSIAFEQSLVEPNMLVVDVEKFISPHAEPWFSVDEKDPVAYAKVEVIEASDLKSADLNGLSDPYVKGHLGGYRFRTEIQKKTLTPKWHEEFKIPIISWECNNVLAIAVLDKDRFYDDTLGDCSVDINDLRDGQRHDMWLPLENIKTGRLHLAVTILEDNGKGFDTNDQETVDIEEQKKSFADDTSNKGSFKSGSTNRNSSPPTPSEKSPKVADNYEPIDVEGQKETGIWVHHPGSEVSQSWEPRKGRNRRLDTEIRKEPSDSFGSCNSITTSGPLDNDSSSPDSNPEDKHRMKTVRKGLHKIGSVFRRSHKREDQLGCVDEEFPSPHDNIRSVKTKGDSIGLKFVMEDNISGFPAGKLQAEAGSNDGSAPESPSKGHVKDMAKNIFKNAGKSARSLKHVLSRKSRNSKSDASGVLSDESDSSGVSSAVQSPIDERTLVASQAMVSSSNGSPKPKVIVVQTVPSNTTVDNGALVKNENFEENPGEEFITPVEPNPEEELVADRKDISFSN
ncbi:PREDICTED: C2 domain-containing protein At1g53590-like isoform X2 [Lupinus angustifolius]|uniref:C2 domain-containing protein At1g53590-like isoform X2 n=1 Tax=Lupinus angustifolius TaxID=3871 RepID=UPI00092E6C7C|nr:PREDICTED: C2 domain-containing protein At1g53590-like isoform X2 [Lupinus angustifolius]